MPKMVCLKCNRELRIDKNGVPAIEMADFGPYKIYSTDRWKCPSCGYTVLAGFSSKCHEDFEKGFKDFLEEARDKEGCTEFR